MDINARINWKPGLEITAETFRELTRDFDLQQQIAVRAALGSAHIGLLPGAAFNNKGMFVRNTFEMPDFKCMALLPSGRILHADEPAVVIITPTVGGNGSSPTSYYYLTVGFSDHQTDFEHKGVPYTRPQYEYAIHQLDDISDTDLMPVARFTVADGMLAYDEQYMAPVLKVGGDERFKQYMAQYADKINRLVSHPNMDNEYGKRALLHYMFLLKTFNMRSTTHEFMMLTQEIVQAVDYYIVSLVEGEGERQIPEPNEYDIQLWLKWTGEYLTGAFSTLDKVEKKDDAFDLEAWKEQIKAELYEQLYRELYASLSVAIKEELTEELIAKLQVTLTNYINDVLKAQLYDELKAALAPELYDELYKALYDALFAGLSLYRPKEEEEDQFVPLI